MGLLLDQISSGALLLGKITYGKVSLWDIKGEQTRETNWKEPPCIVYDILRNASTGKGRKERDCWNIFIDVKVMPALQEELV